MSDEPGKMNTENAQPEEEKLREAANANDAEATEPEAQPEEAVETDAELIARLSAENEELKDRFIRIAADMENLRRRTARDVRDARAYAVTNFARDMLGVGDNLRRALEAIPQEARDAGDAGFKALIEGVEMTERDMLGALERHGVKKLEPKGEKFDPNFHQAMFEVPNPEVPHNSVFEVVQAGYVIGDRVLRPAMVGVAKGGPKMKVPEQEDGQPEDQKAAGE